MVGERGHAYMENQGKVGNLRQIFGNLRNLSAAMNSLKIRVSRSIAPWKPDLRRKMG